MATTLVINPGSTSRKYALYEADVLVRVLFYERTGAGYTMSDTAYGSKCHEEEITAKQFESALEHALQYLLAQQVVLSLKTIDCVGVRIVAPGSRFTEHQEVDEAFVAALAAVADVAPLHIPTMVRELQAVLIELSHAAIIAVSDTAFHTTIPEFVQSISLPKADREQFDIKRFGYHGLSFASVANRLESFFGTVPEKTIVCHLGGGVSIGALKDGVSVATSMGYTPASGMMMGSRGGDVTAGVLATLIQKKKLKGEQLYKYLYEEAGFQGVAGVRDLRLVLERAAQKDADATLALEMFTHQIRSWIGAHVAQLGGLDAIVLTATAAERNPHVRKLVTEKLEVFGIELDEQKNEECIGCEGKLNKKDARVQIGVMRTDEMGEIMRTAQKVAVR